ncbi:MAG TPA: hypothetical protein VK789_05515 [Bryobacteraceae bacterium]|nr:hypothetical protein [Bryobacteraceae bacterium]
MKNICLILSLCAGCQLPAAPAERGIHHPRTSGNASQPLYLTYTVAGSPGSPGYTGDSGPANAAQFANPLCIAVDSKGNYYISDYHNNVIREVFASNGTIATIAGTGTPGLSGDGAPATSAQFSSAQGLAVDGAGNLYIADAPNARVRVVNAAGNISTFAGRGTYGYDGDGTPATGAALYWPTGVAVDSAGNVYIADIGNATVRMVSAASGIISTVAGTGASGSGNFPGEGGPATQAILGQPYAVAVDESGNVYFADVGSSSIREVGKDGKIHTIVSDVSTASLATDPAGNLYFADYRNSVINKVFPDGTVTTIAGRSGTNGFSGDGGPASEAQFNSPYGIAFDSSANLYVADYNNDVIRRLTPVAASNVIVTNGASDIGYSSPGVQLPIAPGELVTIFGANVGSPTPAAAQPGANGVYATQFASTTVKFNGTAAPILVSESGEVSAVVPYEINGATQANIVVTYVGNTTATATVPVAAASPGIFTVNSSGILNGMPALNADGSVNTPANAAADSSVVTVFVTGEGLTTPAGVDGRVNAASNTPAPVQQVTATVAGTSATVASAVEAPGQVAGVLQVNVTLPSTVTKNSAAPVQVQIGNALSQTINIAVQ